MANERKGCLGAMVGLLFGGGRDERHGSALPRVQVNKYFLSAAELSFYHVLRQVVGDRGYVLAQVSLRQLLYLPGSGRSNPGRQTWVNKIAGRSIDFLVCDLKTMRPLVAVELDEPSHARPERQTRDDEVEQILEAAGLPVVRVLTSRSYDTRELAAAIAPHMP